MSQTEFSQGHANSSAMDFLADLKKQKESQLCEEFKDKCQTETLTQENLLQQEFEQKCKVGENEGNSDDVSYETFKPVFVAKKDRVTATRKRGLKMSSK